MLKIHLPTECMSLMNGAEEIKVHREEHQVSEEGREFQQWILRKTSWRKQTSYLPGGDIPGLRNRLIKSRGVGKP